MDLLLTLRLVLIYTAFIAGPIYLAWISYITKNKNELCYKFLIFECSIFPLLDTGLNIGDGWSVGGFLTAVFSIINFSLFKPFFNKSFRLIYILLVTLIISAVLSPYPSNSLLSIYKYITGFIIFFISLRAIKFYGLKKLADTVMKFVTAWTLLFFCVQFFMPEFSLLNFFKIVNDDRLVSCYQDSQISGLVAATISVYYFNQYLKTKNTKLIFLILFCSVLIGFSGSKSALIGEGLGILVSLFFHKIPTKFIFILPALVISIIVSEPYWSELSAFRRMKEMESSTNSRLYYWGLAYSVFDKNAMSGIGSGNFKKYITDNRIPMVHNHSGVKKYADQPESGYLMWLDESGIIGSSIYLLLLLYLLSLKGKGIYNISEVMPFLVSFIGLYTLRNYSILFIVFSLISYIYITSCKLKTIKLSIDSKV